jgi:hypothetical protein
MSETEIFNQLRKTIEQYLKESLSKINYTFEQDGGKNILPPLSKSSKESLSKYGYKLSKTSLSRRRALKKAARSRGTLKVLKRVNLIANYSKSRPKNHRKLRSDVEYLKDTYAKEKIASYKANRLKPFIVNTYTKPENKLKYKN